jgi:hypothetical protein
MVKSSISSDSSPETEEVAVLHVHQVLGPRTAKFTMALGLVRPSRSGTHSQLPPRSEAARGQRD